MNLRQACTQLRVLQRDGRKTSWDLFALLNEINSKGLWKKHYRSWGAFVAANCDWSVDSVRTCMWIQRLYTKEEWVRLGRHRLTIISVLKNEFSHEFAQLRKIGQRYTLRALKHMVEEVQGVVRELPEQLVLTGPVAKRLRKIAIDEAITPEQVVSRLLGSTTRKKGS